MANFRPATNARNAALDAINTAINAGSGAGKIRIYDGTQPANANTAVSTQTLLAELPLSDPATPSASSGTLTFSAITNDSSADATGAATWARVLDSDNNAIFDCDVSSTVGSGTLKLNTTSIASGGPVAITSFTISIAAA